jgi:hypothetical protein
VKGEYNYLAVYIMGLVHAVLRLIAIGPTKCYGHLAHPVLELLACSSFNLEIFLMVGNFLSFSLSESDTCSERGLPQTNTVAFSI